MKFDKVSINFIPFSSKYNIRSYNNTLSINGAKNKRRV